MRPRICIISPALADANDGNWQTARRWAAFLARRCEVEIARDWDGSAADAMIALHARRSAGAVRRFSRTGQGLAVVLTGTDLYRDIREEPAAKRSLELAHRLVVLQERGVDEIPAALRARVEVIYQSARTLARGRPRKSSFDLAMVGHLRAEKDPMTALRALARLAPGLAPHDRLRLIHVGGDKDAALGRAFREKARADNRVSLAGIQPHARTRQIIRNSRVLLLPSLMEGGANVLIEAVTASVPVLASRIPGSVGMLGARYEGFFEVGDDAGLARLIHRCQVDPTFLDQLRAQCANRAPLFEPQRERAAVRSLTHNLLEGAYPAPRLPARGDLLDDQAQD
ncbi:MAG: TIGR04348 family glycosyltransferase [Burkholderiaceae bacterium]|nr:TIGR04348 family glycosyltransferase [Burkholderiaceae bacterium]